ncbi:MAG: T9SS type A sorting domain-containing protein [Candidatus Stahlbacteria bacterium]|nr:MAG: T9SS type A sorting domain-containing protein [Candidatus Stahlbacteria bacterium]
MLRVYDALGRQIDQKNVRSSGEVEFSSNLTTGVYFLQLTSPAGRTTAKVIILN